MRRAAGTALLGVPETGPARLWLGNAVGVLLLAGLLALVLVIGRMPPFDRWITDPDLLRRCLVVHVVLSLVLWFPSFTAVLLLLLPPAGTGGRRLAAATPCLAAAGVFLLFVSAWLPGTKPVLANYVPVVDHWLFLTGLATFGVAVVALALSRDLRGRAPRPATWLAIPPAAQSSLRAAVVGLLLAAVTLAGSIATLPAGLAATAHYELEFWGFGHLLQVVSVCAMLACWQILVAGVTGRAPIGPRAGAWLQLLLLGPWLLAPLLAAGGATTAAYRTGFTRLMQFAIFPVVLVALWACARALLDARRRGVRLAPADPRVAGFVASAVLTIAGFLLGAAIRGSSTIIPAHYHANIGAVTVAFMATGYGLLQPLGWRLAGARAGRLAARQPWLYGGGQLLFALGFALAGAHGAARKVYGVEQQDRGAIETLGLCVMGVGGFVAIAGGVLFLVLLLGAWRHAARELSVPFPETSRGR